METMPVGDSIIGNIDVDLGKFNLNDTLFL